MNRRLLRVHLLWLLLPLLAGWQWPGETNRLVAEAEQAYREGRYEAAARQYGEAMQGAGSAELGYNLGTSLYQQRNYAGAAELLGRIAAQARTPELQNKLHYNRGNAYYRLDRLDEAAKAYEEALKADPNDADAAYNLELCRRRQNQGGKNGQGSPPPGPQPPAGGAQAGGAPQPNPGQPPPGGMSESEANRILESLKQEERAFRPHFGNRTNRGRHPLDPSLDFEEMVKNLKGSSSARDW